MEWWIHDKIHGCNQKLTNGGKPSSRAVQCAQNYTLKDHGPGDSNMEARVGLLHIPIRKYEEEQLVKFLIQVVKIGYGKTKQEVITIVKWMIEKKGLNVKKSNGEGWWSQFKQRNPCVWLCTANSLVMLRSDCTCQEVFDEYLLNCLKARWSLLSFPTSHSTFTIWMRQVRHLMLSSLS